MSNTEKITSVRAARVKRRDIDFIRALRSAENEKVKEQRRGRPGGIIWIACAAVVAAAGALYASAAMRHSQLSDQNDELLADISLAKIHVSEAKQLSLKLGWAKDMEENTGGQLAALEDSGSQYEYYASDLFARIRRQFPGGTSIESIELNDSILTFSFRSDKASEAAELVQKLRSEEIFSWIDYSGFTSDESGSETLFTIICGLTDEMPEEEGTR